MREPRIKLLVVDDDEVDRLAVRRLLAGADLDADVHEATTADEAVARVAAEPFDLILSDYHLPGHDGLWLLRTLRARGIEIPVVVLTGQGDEETAVELMKSGAADYLVKAGLSVDAVTRSIRNAIRIATAEAEAHRVVAALHKSEHGLRIALEAADLGTWSYDIRGNVIEWDGRARAILGIADARPRDLQGALELVEEEDRARLHALLHEQLAGPQTSRYEAELRVRHRSGGGVRWLRAIGRTLFEGDEPVRILGVMQDITEDRARDEAARRHAEFEQQLLGIVSHDLRNPLSTMMMSAQVLLRREQLDAVSAKLLGRIVSSGERAARMIRDLLDLTRARAASGIPVEPKLVDLELLVRQTLDEIGLGHPDRTIAHAHHGPTDGVWDPDRLSQIVTNLVSNALTYSPPGTPVTVTTEGGAGWARLSVHNDGPPIPEEIRAGIFRPFTRASTTTKDRSIGLGLFIVKELVTAHGGTVEVESAEGMGTRFTVQLPRRAITSPDAPISPT